MARIGTINYTNYDRELSERSYYDSLGESNQPTCQGCIDLDAGHGGENQLAHMYPGGCLYDSNEYNLDYETQDELETKNIEEDGNKTKNSIPENKNEINIKNTGRFTIHYESVDISPEELEKRYDNERLMKYESFIADSYAVTPHSLK